MRSIRFKAPGWLVRVASGQGQSGLVTYYRTSELAGYFNNSVSLWHYVLQRWLECWRDTWELVQMGDDPPWRPGPRPTVVRPGEIVEEVDVCQVKIWELDLEGFVDEVDGNDELSYHLLYEETYDLSSSGEVSVQINGHSRHKPVQLL